MEVKTVLAVDPGSSKCGFALVRREAEGHLTLLWRGVFGKDEIAKRIDEANAVQHFNMVIVGAGTRSREVVNAIRDAMPSVGVLVVDEKNTTLEARERYWEHHRRRGWRRLLPSTMQEPPEPVDDFVALILAERVLLA